MISTLKKRDQKLAMVGVAREHTRIQKQQLGFANAEYEKKKKMYEKWCEENKVETLLSD